MLFKVANLDRLQALQRGLLYMNSVDYFAKLEGEAGAALRRDELENVYLKLSSGIRDGCLLSRKSKHSSGNDEEGLGQIRADSGSPATAGRPE